MDLATGGASIRKVVFVRAGTSQLLDAYLPSFAALRQWFGVMIAMNSLTALGVGVLSTLV